MIFFRSVTKKAHRCRNFVEIFGLFLQAPEMTGAFLIYFLAFICLCPFPRCVCSAINCLFMPLPLVAPKNVFEPVSFLFKAHYKMNLNVFCLNWPQKKKLLKCGRSWAWEAAWKMWWMCSTFCPAQVNICLSHARHSFCSVWFCSTHLHRRLASA